ncbi:MAG: hypothetical protein FWC26_14420 [Fibromonadales bacterium]|nr:hypothetical protein [Fibromonadales bacterium]
MNSVKRYILFICALLLAACSEQLERFTYEEITISNSSSSAEIQNPSSSSSSQILSSSSSLLYTCNSKGYNPETQYCKDGRDTASYDNAVVKNFEIGSQIWMAKNYDIDYGNSRCVNPEDSLLVKTNTAFCDKYGRLYDWETAKQICPDKWHLPTVKEWNELIKSAISEIMAATALKALSGWENNGNGTVNYGFMALPGGYGSSEGDYHGNTTNGYWWSSDSVDSGKAYSFKMQPDSNNVIKENFYDKSDYLSVRCIKD